MTEIIKTLKDCAGCLCVSICNAHITGGTWKHRGGINPCRVRPEITEEPISRPCAPVMCHEHVSINILRVLKE